MSNIRFKKRGLGLRTRIVRCLLRPLLNVPAAPVILLVIMLQAFWLLYDQQITKAVTHKLPKVYEKPTNDSPLSPFYSEPYDGPARAFPKYKYDFPCGPLVHVNKLQDRSVTNEGFLFVKEMKSGSTTLAGITARIARNVAQREHHVTNSTTACTARMVHTRARKYNRRIQDKSFVWSVIREPVSRLFSKFYHFEVSRANVQPSLATFQKFINTNEVNDYAYYFKTLTMRKHMNPYRDDLYELFLKNLLSGYNFLGITERMDESLAVLQLLLNLKTEDMLYLSAKTSGSYELFRRKCIKIQETNVTQSMKEYVYSEMFEKFTEPDVLVYRAVNKSLDLTIEQIGRTKVDQTIKQLQYALVLAQEKCKSVAFPCTDDGTIQEPNDCLFTDVSCGYKCLDEVGKSLETDKDFLALSGNI